MPEPILIRTDPRICAECHKGPFPATVELWPEVVAYERPRGRRGPNSGSSLIARRRTGRHICQSCASKLELGLTTAQGTLGI